MSELTFQSDPSGTIIGYKAKGIGSAEEGIQSLLDKQYIEGMSIEDGEKLALQCLKQVMEEKIRPSLVDLVVVDVENKTFTRRDRNHKNNIIENLPSNID